MNADEGGGGTGCSGRSEVEQRAGQHHVFACWIPALGAGSVLGFRGCGCRDQVPSLPCAKAKRDTVTTATLGSWRKLSEGLNAVLFGIGSPEKERLSFWASQKDSPRGYVQAGP